MYEKKYSREKKGRRSRVFIHRNCLYFFFQLGYATSTLPNNNLKNINKIFVYVGLILIYSIYRDIITNTIGHYLLSIFLLEKKIIIYF